MGQHRELTDQEIDEIARRVAEAPRIRTVSDVETLGQNAEVVRACKLTDETLARLAERVPGLRILASDGNSRVTDAGLDALRQFTRLESLDLEWSAVSDAGLPRIAAVRTLRWLDVFGTRVTASGVAELRATRPDLEIES